MSATLLLVSLVTALSVIPMGVASMRSELRTPMLYSYIATMTVIAGLLGPVYTIPLTDGVELWAGQLFYASFIFTTLLTALLARDLRVVRQAMGVVVLVNLVAALAYATTHAALASGMPNPLGVPSEMFEASMTQQLVGIALSVIELVLLLAILEWTKARLSSRAMVPVYPFAFLVVLLFDGALYPLLVLRPGSGIVDVIVGGLSTKLVIGVAYAVPLLVFVLVRRPDLRDFERHQLGLRYLADFSRDPLLDQLDTSTRTASRASATTARILDAATGTVLVATDTDLVVTHVNSGASRILAVVIDDLLGHDLGDLLPSKEVARQAGALGVSPTLGEVVGAQVRADEPRDWCFSTDDTTLVLSLNITVIESDGNVDGYLFAGEDVTSRQRAEDAVRATLDNEQASLARLREADQVKQQLISTVSHELRTPIASIQGYLELLADGDYGDLSDPQSDAVERALRNTSRLERLVTDLLILERAEAGPLVEDRQQVDLGEIVRECADLLRRRAADHTLSLDLPATPVTAYGDPEALHRVVLNLVDNGVKFTPAGGEVVVRLRGLSPGARLEVADTGIGIRPDDLPHVFTKFFRTAEAVEMEAQGTGLGLSIVHSLVDDHRGAVRIDSERHRGTTVTVELPA